VNIRYDAATMSSSFLSKPNLSTAQFVEKTGHLLKTEVIRTSCRSTELIRNSKPSTRPITGSLQLESNKYRAIDNSLDKKASLSCEITYDS